MFEITFDEANKKLDVHNLFEFKEEINAPVLESVRIVEYDSALSDFGLNVLKPIDDNKEFIFTYSGTVVLKNFLYEESLIGRSLGDLFPYLKEYAYPIFKNVYENDIKDSLTLSFYDGETLCISLEFNISKNDEEIFLIYSKEPFVDNYALNNLLFKQSNRLASQKEALVIENNESSATFIIQNLKTNTFTWGRRLEEIFEGPIDKDADLMSIFFEHILPEDLEIVQKLFFDFTPEDPFIETDYRITTFKGNLRYLHLVVEGFVEDGEIVEFMQIVSDVTDLKERNQRLLTLNSTVQDMQAASSLSVHYLDANKNYIWSDETYQIIDREPREDDYNHNIIVELFSQEDQDKYNDLVENLAPNEFLGDHTFQLITESGKKKWIKVNARAIYNEINEFVRRSEYAQDVTTQVEHENFLIKSDAEKTVLIKEVHHRVKNNLQTITSLISLEEKFETNPAKILDVTKSRVSALALIHETIYNEEDMNYITLSEFFPEFDNKLKSLATYPDIEFIEDIEDLTLFIDSVTPLVLMTNELTTNSFKHAFEEDDESKKITKTITSYEENGIKMCKYHYKDNGKGLPDDFDIDNQGTLGWTIIKSLVAQLDGEYELFSDNGFNFVLTFPIIMK